MVENKYDGVRGGGIAFTGWIAAGAIMEGQQSLPDQTVGVGVAAAMMLIFVGAREAALSPTGERLWTALENRVRNRISD